MPPEFTHAFGERLRRAAQATPGFLELVRVEYERRFARSYSAFASQIKVLVADCCSQDADSTKGSQRFAWQRLGRELELAARNDLAAAVAHVGRQATFRSNCRPAWRRSRDQITRRQKPPGPPVPERVGGQQS